MVSYSTAKAEALGVPAPRGAMRRQERAVYLVVGVGLVPVAAAACARMGLPLGSRALPLLAVLGLVAVVGNVSAVRRLRAIAEAVREPQVVASKDVERGERDREGTSCRRRRRHPLRLATPALPPGGACWGAISSAPSRRPSSTSGR